MGTSSTEGVNLVRDSRSKHEKYHPHLKKNFWQPMVHDFILGNFVEYHLRQAGLQKNNVTTLS